MPLEWLSRITPDDWGTVIRLVWIIVLGLVFRWLAHRGIERAIRAIRQRPTRADRPGRSGPNSRREQRLGALTGFAKALSTVIIAVVVVTLCLGVVGIDTRGLVAGTSLVVAVLGFGLQNVIKDFVAGLSMLLDDQLGVGDFVALGEAKGAVVELGLRTTTLRDDDGNVHYVRNGEVTEVVNYSQGGTGRPPTEPQPEYFWPISFASGEPVPHPTQPTRRPEE